MDFTPLVLGNMKGFFNRTPTPEDMRYWAERQGLSLPMVTAFTDGTKLQIEQCLAGTYLEADIACEVLLGPACASPTGPTIGRSASPTICTSAARSSGERR